MLKKPEGKQVICSFLKAADISIDDIEVITRRIPGQAVHFDLVAGKTEVREQEHPVHELRFRHVTDNGNAVFGINDESAGTRNLVFLTGPLLDILDKGMTLIT